MATITTAPSRLAGYEWADEFLWERIDPSLYAALEFTMTSLVLNFYTPAVDVDGATEKGYADPNVAVRTAAILAHNTREQALALLNDDEALREYNYLAEDGHGTPGEQLYREWVADLS